MAERFIHWPKKPEPLTDQQRQAKADFLKIWHEVLPRKYGLIEKFNHESPIIQESLPEGTCRTLEIGAGLGEHIAHEDLSRQQYTAIEIRPDFVARIRERYPAIDARVGDIQAGVDLPSASFDRILAIHVLEHLPDLPRALAEIHRLLSPGGVFIPVIPCEGGLAYGLARRISAQRIFEREFKIPYGPIIANEHVSRAWEILQELGNYFEIERRSFWPLRIPVTGANLVIALRCRPRVTQ